jgi:hypothetical protein
MAELEVPKSMPSTREDVCADPGDKLRADVLGTVVVAVGAVREADSMQTVMSHMLAAVGFA